MTSPQPTNNSVSEPTNSAPQPAARRPNQPPQKRKSNAKAWFVILPVLGGTVWFGMFLSGMVTLGGVPFSVVSRVLRTPATRSALFTFRAATLHNLMDDMGIEEEIKLYHSKHIQDPVELDQHIHQILYNWTRYVGENYVVGARGKLIPKTYDIVDEIYECPGC